MPPVYAEGSRELTASQHCFIAGMLACRTWLWGVLSLSRPLAAAHAVHACISLSCKVLVVQESRRGALPAERTTLKEDGSACLVNADEMFYLQGDISARKMIFGVEGVDPRRRDELIELLDIDLRWRLNVVSDGQRRRVQICMGLLRPYQVSVCGPLVYLAVRRWGAFMLCVEVAGVHLHGLGLAVQHYSRVLWHRCNCCTHQVFIAGGACGPPQTLICPVAVLSICMP